MNRFSPYLKSFDISGLLTFLPLGFLLLCSFFYFPRSVVLTLLTPNHSFYISISHLLRFSAPLVTILLLLPSPTYLKLILYTPTLRYFILTPPFILFKFSYYFSIIINISFSQPQNNTQAQEISMMILIKTSPIKYH